jgi:hypothetical protein
MRRFRFKIANLLVVVLFFAVGFAALRESNEIWDSGLFSLTLGVLLISILLGVHRVEARRAFWFGFALFGLSYLGLSVVPSLESRLITTKALAYLDSKMPGRSLGTFTFRVSATGSGAPSNQIQNVTFTADGTQLTTSSQGQVKIWDAATGRLLGGWSGTTENFVRIGHSLIALLASWLGGLLSRRLWRASRLSDLESAEHS